MHPKHAGSTDTIFAIFVDTTVWAIDTSKYCTTGYYFLVCLLASAVVRKFCASPHWQHTSCDWAKKASLWCPSLSSQTDKQTWLIAWFLQLFCFCNVSIFPKASAFIVQWGRQWSQLPGRWCLTNCMRTKFITRGTRWVEVSWVHTVVFRKEWAKSTLSVSGPCSQCSHRFN